MLTEVVQDILDGARLDAKESAIQDVSVLLLDGDPADQILRCIDEQGIDCVAMGSRGLSDIKAVFLGSVSHKVTNRAPGTCIAVKYCQPTCNCCEDAVSTRIRYWTLSPPAAVDSTHPLQLKMPAAAAMSGESMAWPWTTETSMKGHKIR